MESREPIFLLSLDPKDYLCIRKGCLINIFGRTDRRFAGHDLPDKLLLGFHQLIKVGIKGVLCDVGVDFYLRVLISLTDDPPFPLLQICGSDFADILPS